MVNNFLIICLFNMYSHIIKIIINKFKGEFSLKDIRNQNYVNVNLKSANKGR